MNTTHGSSQVDLAGELGVTPRRIRQLIAEGVLPAANEAGSYDVQACLQRHELFIARHDAGAWSGFEEELVRHAKRTERLVAAALKPGATGPQLRAASLATQHLFADLKFMTTARSRSDAERALHLEMWREREDRALGALVTAAAEVLAGPRDAALQVLPV